MQTENCEQKWKQKRSQQRVPDSDLNMHGNTILSIHQEDDMYEITHSAWGYRQRNADYPTYSKTIQKDNSSNDYNTTSVTGSCKSLQILLNISSRFKFFFLFGPAKWFLGIQDGHVSFTCFFEGVIARLVRFTGAHQLLLYVFKFGSGPWCRAYTSSRTWCIYCQFGCLIPRGIPIMTTGNTLQLNSQNQGKKSMAIGRSNNQITHTNVYQLPETQRLNLGLLD